MNRRLPIRHIGDGDEGLHGDMHDLLSAEFMFEDMIRSRKGRLHIAAPQLVIERDIGAAPALEMLQIGEGGGWLQLVVNQRFGLSRLHFVEDGGQFLIFHFDQGERFFGDLAVVGQHHRHRLACEADLTVGQHGLVMEGGAVIGVGENGLDVVDGDDAVDAFQRRRRRDVDLLDQRMGHGAAENFAVKHAREAQMVHIFRAARDLGAGLEAGNGATDLGRGIEV